MPQSIAPSSSPPPPTSSGAIYIIAVIALVAAIGGLVCWKIKGSKDTPAPVATTPVATAPTMLEPPPPPPPIEEDAGSIEAGAVRTAGNYNPCSAKCSGSANSTLQAAISGRAGAARPCYERALRVNSALQGKLMISVRIDPQGNVCSSSIAQDQIHSPEVANCVMGMFRTAKFPPPTSGCVDVQVPLSFVPREGK